MNIPSTGVSSLAELGVTASAAEVSYTDGVTSAIQTQLDGRLRIDQNLFDIEDYAVAQQSLHLEPGVDVQAYRAELTAQDAATYSVASAATVNLDNATSDSVTITGSTGPITSFGTVAAGRKFHITFASTPTITYNAVSLITPTGASIVAVAGDTMVLVSLGSGNWRIFEYAGQNIKTAGVTITAPITPLSCSSANSGYSFSIGNYSVSFGSYTASFLGGSVGSPGGGQLAVTGGSGGVNIHDYRCFVTPTETIINDAGLSTHNFRVETDTNTHMIFVDSANNRMSIGSSTNAGYMLQVNGGLNVTGDVCTTGGNLSARTSAATWLQVGTAGQVYYRFGTTAGGYAAQFISLYGHSYVQYTDGLVTIGNYFNGTGGITINESGADVDSRFEGDTDANLLTIDAGNDSIGIGIALGSHNAAAKFQIDSTTKGMLPPRHTTAQRGAVSTPPEGLFVHDTNLYRPYVRSNSAWQPVAFQTDRIHGSNAYVNGSLSHAFGNFQSYENYESGMGALTANSEVASVIIRKDGLYHTPDEGLNGTYENGTQIASLVGFTNNATPIILGVSRSDSLGLPIPVDYAAAFDGVVIGIDTNNYECCSYQIKGMVKNVAGTLSLLGSSVTVLHEEDATWDVSLGVDSTTDCLEITVTGDASNQVRWTASLRMAYNSMIPYIL